MKKLAICLLVSAALATPASAGDLGQFFAGRTFNNRGQCESALIAARNDRRNNDGNTGNYSDPAYNQIVHDKYGCEQVADRIWIVVLEWPE